MRHGWSLDNTTWVRLRKRFGNRHWRRVPFGALHANTVPEAAGVYALCTPGLLGEAGLLGELYNTVYVGRAADLRRRFLEHSRYPGLEISRAIRCFASLDYWYATANLDEIDDFESDLISCLGPSANQRGGIQAQIGTGVRI